MRIIIDIIRIYYVYFIYWCQANIVMFYTKHALLLITAFVLPFLNIFTIFELKYALLISQKYMQYRYTIKQ